MESYEPGLLLTASTTVPPGPILLNSPKWQSQISVSSWGAGEVGDTYAWSQSIFVSEYSA